MTGSEQGALRGETLPLLGIAAWSGTGKTTLLEALLPRLAERGLRVAVIKHAHHDFEVDRPGKDSHRLRQAGAAPMLVASRRRVALMFEAPGEEDPDLPELIELLRPLPKLELHRAELGKPLLAPQDPWVQAVASPSPLTLPEGVVGLDLNDHAALADWVAAWPGRWPAVFRPRCEEGPA